MAGRAFAPLHYDPETGVFSYTSGPRAGQVAGCLTNRGYWQVIFNKRPHLAHRVAWFIVHGEWPTEQIDHINGVRTDNRIANIRQVSAAVNLQNQRRARGNNKTGTGLLGVHKKGAKWRALVTVNGVKHLSRVFDTPEQAHEAYISLKRRLHVGCTI